MTSASSVSVNRRPTRLRADVWIRDRVRVRLWAAAALALASFWVVMFVRNLQSPGPWLAHHPGERLSIAAFFLAIAAALGYVAFRVLRSGIRVSREQVVVRGPFWTRRLATQDVRGAAPGVQAGIGNGTPCPVLALADGRSAGVWALGRDGLIHSKERMLESLAPVCAELDALISELRRS